MIKTLLKQVKQYKTVSILTPVFIILEVIMEVLLPYITANIIDKGINAGDMNKVYFYGVAMLVMAFLSLSFAIIAGKFAAKASAGFACNLRDAMYENIQKFSFSNIDKFSTAGLVTRMTTDVTNVQNAYQMILRIAVRAPLMFICSMFMSFFINVRLSLIFLAAVIFLAVIIILIIGRTMKIFDNVFKKYDDLNASVQENVSAIRVVKAFVREEHENEKFTRAAQNLYGLFVKAEKMIALNGPIMMFVIYFCIIALSWFGSKFIVAGNLTTGELTSMFSYVMGILMSLMMLSMVFVMITMSIASAKRISEVINEQPDIKNPQNPVMEILNGSIDFNNVSFSYKHGTGEETLSGIDLHIKSGETIGIIGGTGCGKSSFANLISRLYDVDSGEVLVGGKNVKDYDLDILRNNVAVVLQKNVLFSGTILENLRWGKDDASAEEIEEALSISQAKEFVDAKEGRLAFQVEQGGRNLSGGQKQRLTIARALVRRPEILILDDSASALDFATDAALRKAIHNMKENPTVFIVSQRAASIQYADQIIVLDDGEMAGIGTHDELMKDCEVYKEIYYSQYPEERLKAEAAARAYEKN